jgi:hypothetical protein
MLLEVSAKMKELSVKLNTMGLCMCQDAVTPYLVF